MKTEQDKLKSPHELRRSERQTTPLRVGLVLIAAAPFIMRACHNDLISKPFPHEPTPTPAIVRSK